MTLSTHPAWFTPRRLLAIFCFTNLCVYLDRGLISSNGVNGSARTETVPKGTGIQGEFGLSYFQDGLLPAAFMVGLLVASVVFAEVCKRRSPFRLLGIGMGIWSLACLLCGLAPSYPALLAARMIVGVGEASFVAMAAPFIDDYAPLASKAQWFATFYLCIPVGFALGYVVGGLVAPALGWRAAFMLEAVAMVPFVIFALTAEPLALQGTADLPATQSYADMVSEESRLLGPAVSLDTQQQHTNSSSTAAGSVEMVHGGNPALDSDTEVPRHPQAEATQGSAGHTTWVSYLRAFTRDLQRVVSQRVWALSCVGYTVYVAVLGVYAYWGPKAGYALFFSAQGDSGQEADLVFGAVTVLTGVTGSVLGGVLLDKLGDSLRTACTICAASCISGLCVVLVAFLASGTYAVFMSVFAVGQLCIFVLQAPVVAIQMWCVPQSLRALGSSLMTVSIHLLGDVPSPPLVGLLQSRLAEGLSRHKAAEKWRISMSLISSLLSVAGLFFLLARKACGPGTDFRTHAGGQQGRIRPDVSGADASKSREQGTVDRDVAGPLLPG